MLSTLHSPFLQVALVGSLLVGGVCAYLGVHVVLRRVVFVGAALAQVSSAGVGLALCTGRNPSVLSLILTMVGVAAFSVRAKGHRTTQESLIGVGYAVASALAVLFVAKSAQGEAHMLEVLSGNILTVTTQQVWWMAGVGAAAVALHALFHKQFYFCSFDAETAQASGFRAARWDLAFFLILGMVISLAIRLAGTLMVFAFLVLPAVTAMIVSRRLGHIYAVAIGSASLATIVGMLASIRWDLPAGPAIVACSFALAGIAWAVSRVK